MYSSKKKYTPNVDREKILLTCFDEKAEALDMSCQFDHMHTIFSRSFTFLFEEREEKRNSSKANDWYIKPTVRRMYTGEREK